MKIALDIDGCITQYPKFFSMLSQCMKQQARIYVITNRDPGTRAQIEEELREYGVAFHELIITVDKAKFIMEHGIEVLYEDTDECFLELPSTVCVCKVREPGNFNYETRRWFYGPRTGEII
jgi:hypothetical protein